MASQCVMSTVDGDWENWMSKLPPALRRAPVNYLAIPGSHDSMTFSLQPTSPIGPDEPKWMQKLASSCGTVIKPVVYRWSKTQFATTVEQLRMGIRYFDLRLATLRNRNGVYVVHGLYGDNVLVCLNDVAQFLASHPREIVVLDLQHFYGFTAEHHAWLVRQIVEIFGRRLHTIQCDISNITLEKMAEIGTQIFVIYRDPSAEGINQLWPSKAFPNPWPDTVDLYNLYTFLDKNVQQRSANCFYVTQGVLTPDVPFVAKNLCSTLEEKCGIPTMRTLVPWLETKSAGPQGVNIVIADFVGSDGFPFIESVVKLNDKLIAKKEQLEQGQ